MIEYHQTKQNKMVIFVEISDKSNFLRSTTFFQESEMRSRYVDTHRDVSQAELTVPLHSHGFYELLYCRSGTGVEYILDTEQKRLKKGDILFVAPGISHRPILPERLEEPYIRDVIRISRDFMEEVRERFMPEAGDFFGMACLFRLESSFSAQIGDLFRKGVLEAETGEIGWEAAVAANTLSILTGLRRAMATQPPVKTERAELMDQMLQYVELHLSDKITIAEVAKHFFISQSTITQTFRKRMGISFYRCVTLRRLEAARELISQGVPLETVAEQVGFSDYSAFFRAFKGEFGISPRQYRKSAGSSQAERKI